MRPETSLFKAFEIFDHTGLADQLLLRITYGMAISQHRSAELTLRTLPADQRMIEVEGVSRFLIQTP
jgi:hypothetical protein